MSTTETEVLQEIQRILHDKLESPQQVTSTGLLVDCAELDSLGLITLAVGLEDRFRVKLSEADAPGLVTFSDVARLVVQRCQEGGR